MSKYALKRLLLFIPMLLGITFVTFLFIHLAPGNFLDTLKLNPQISPQVIADYEAKFHLDKPVGVQYFFWLKSIILGDLGYSFAYKAPVAEVLLPRAGNTLLLSLSSVLVTWLFVVPLGVVCAMHKGRLIDKSISFVSYVGISLPSFFVALILLCMAAVTGVLPLGGMRSVNYDELSLFYKAWDIARHLAIPVTVLSLSTVCALTPVLRSSLLEAMNSNYILAARARGLSGARVVCVHAMKNAINPMITIFGYQFSELLSGAALVEIVCGWPGLGTVTLDAVRSQDVYLVMGTVLIGGVLLILGNLLADILLGLNDPRIRYDKENIQ